MYYKMFKIGRYELNEINMTLHRWINKQIDDMKFF